MDVRKRTLYNLHEAHINSGATDTEQVLLRLCCHGTPTVSAKCHRAQVTSQHSMHAAHIINSCTLPDPAFIDTCH